MYNDTTVVSNIIIDKEGQIIVQNKRLIEQCGINLRVQDKILIANLVNSNDELQTVSSLLLSNKLTNTDHSKEYQIFKRLKNEHPTLYSKLLIAIARGSISIDDSDTSNIFTVIRLETQDLNRNSNEAVTQLLTMVANIAKPNMKLSINSFDGISYGDQPWLQAFVGVYDKLDHDEKKVFLKGLFTLVSTHFMDSKFQKLIDVFEKYYGIKIDLPQQVTDSNLKTEEFIAVPKKIADKLNIDYMLMSRQWKFNTIAISIIATGLYWVSLHLADYTKNQQSQIDTLNREQIELNQKNKQLQQRVDDLKSD